MKKKLTITVDADVLPLAKRYAKSKGVSLSSLVEQALREMTDEWDLEQQQEPSFVEKWRGKFGPMTDEEIDAARYEYLAQRERDLEQEPSFVEKWRGKFKLAERGTPRYEALVRKYLGC